MKIASTTGVDVFFMIQTAEGRRFFSGESSLTDCYLNHRLVPSSNDIQMYLAPNVSALRQKRSANSADDYAGFYVPQSFESCHPAGPQQEPLQTLPSQSALNDPRRHPFRQSPQSPSSSLKRARLAANSTLSEPLRKRRHNSKSYEVSADPSATDIPNVKREEDESLCKEGENCGLELDDNAKETSSCEIIDWEAEDDDVTILDDDDEGNASRDDFGSDDAANVHERTLALKLESELSNPLPTDSDYSSSVSWLVSKILTHPKLEAVLLVCDASVADKDSIASKLLNSLLYEYAKLAAHECPYETIEDPRCKEFYSMCFEALWTHLPNLQKLHEDGIRVTRGNGYLSRMGKRRTEHKRATTSYSLKAAMRETMRKCFRVLHSKAVLLRKSKLA